MFESKNTFANRLQVILATYYVASGLAILIEQEKAQSLMFLAKDYTSKHIENIFYLQEMEFAFFILVYGNISRMKFIGPIFHAFLISGLYLVSLCF